MEQKQKNFTMYICENIHTFAKNKAIKLFQQISNNINRTPENQEIFTNINRTSENLQISNNINGTYENQEVFTNINGTYNNNLDFINIEGTLFNNLEANKSKKVKDFGIIQDEFICDDPLYICALKQIILFIEEKSYQLLFFILSALLILLIKIFSIYKNQNSKNKKKMNLKEFIKFLKKNYPYLLYLFYILLLFLFIILSLNISKKVKEYALNIFKGMDNLYKTYKRVLRLFSKVEFLEKLQKLGFEKLNQDVESLFDMVNDHLLQEVINLKKEMDQIKKEIIDINSNIIIF